VFKGKGVMTVLGRIVSRMGGWCGKVVELNSGHRKLRDGGCDRHIQCAWDGDGVWSSRLVVIFHIWDHKKPLRNRRLATLATVNSSQLASKVLAFTEGVILTIYGR